MVPVKVPADDAFVATEALRTRAGRLHVGCGRLLAEGNGPLLRAAVEGRAGQVRNDLHILLRDVLRIAPADRRFYGIL